ncbi:type II secretion system protein [Pseudomonas jilinensis]|uniref:Type II secretion system protein G n=1 Tax=Pseudomonas jilinensis TaxID=2078689 RepID=A0A396S1W3_9PSED|nr:prepilin-type N-terminal cleavage/methylation domain-containing protein [Pseudomonas jilinensis]RHW22527.1 type II secretion system protein G [Pseudomonas jilinensis]
MKTQSGFTLIELLVVMVIVATLLSIATPRYFNSLEESKETTLKQSLAVMRDMLDQYYGDTGRYPESIEELVEQRYLRQLPEDPFTGSRVTWIEVPPPDGVVGRVADIHSAATGQARDGSWYAHW